MSIINRTYNIISSKINKLLEKIEDPREELDSSYEHQLDLLQNVKKGIVDLTTAKKNLEEQKVKLCQDFMNIDEQAKILIKQNNEPLARAVVERKIHTQEEIDSLTQQIKNLRIQQDKLIEQEKVFEIKVAEFRSKKETVKAQYSAAEAQVKINESLSGISGGMNNAGNAMRKAEDRTQTMTARSSAIDELTDSGVLDNSIDGTTSLDRDLKKAKTKDKVDAEFEAMKRRL